MVAGSVRRTPHGPGDLGPSSLFVNCDGGCKSSSLSDSERLSRYVERSMERLSKGAMLAGCPKLEARPLSGSRSMRQIRQALEARWVERFDFSGNSSP